MERNPFSFAAQNPFTVTVFTIVNKNAYKHIVARNIS